MGFLKKIFGKNITPSNIPNIILDVRDNNITYLDEEALLDLSNVITQIENNRVEGVLIETGCALGGSSIVIAAAKKKDRKFLVYDIFGMIPSPSNRDGNDVLERYKVIKEGNSAGLKGETYYGYQDNLLNKVKANFKDYKLDIDKNNVKLIEGLYQDTLKIDFSVAMAHIDCDWYDSVMTCLNQIVPQLAVGGILIIDDYYVWSGCTKAVDEYFLNIRDKFVFTKKSRLHITKL